MAILIGAFVSFFVPAVIWAVKFKLDLAEKEQLPCMKPYQYQRSIIEPSPYKVSDYYDHIEKAQVEILNNQKPIDNVIILWFGLDGLRINKDGTSKWIKRNEPKEATSSMCSYFSPQQSIIRSPNELLALAGMLSCTSMSPASAYMSFRYNPQMQLPLGMSIASQIRNMNQQIAMGMQQCTSYPDAEIMNLQSKIDLLNRQEQCCVQTQRIIELLGTERDINGTIKRF